MYVYDPNGRLQAIAALVQLSMTDGSSIYAMYPVTQYICGPDRVLAKIDKTTNKSYYYLYNGHGDVVQIVDTPGAIKNTYDYDIWGNFLKKEETIENHFTYFGQTYDETTGLYYLRARYYDPTTGRFTQQDPAEDGYNWYIYGNNNPIKYIDPNGLYNREKVKDYIENWWDDRNNDYYSYRTDCANFVSQCLYAGDIEMKKEWYSYKEGKISGFNIMGMFHNNYKYKWNVAESWRLAKKQFEYFSNPYHGFIEGEVLQLWSEEGMKYNIRHNNIQVGDLMYFADKDTREIYHATIISKIEDDKIYFAGHTTNRYEQDLSSYFEDEMVFVIKIRNDAIRGYIE